MMEENVAKFGPTFFNLKLVAQPLVSTMASVINNVWFVSALRESPAQDAKTIRANMLV
jgi:hypothetical protein